MEVIHEVTNNHNQENLLKEGPNASMSFVSSIINSHLIQKEIPNNLVFTDLGMTCYIIPRKLLSEDLGINSSWQDLCGIPCIFNKKILSEVNEKGVEVLSKIISQEISLKESDFKVISNEISQKFKERFITK